MKIEIKVDDFPLFLKALNNAVVSYNSIIFSIIMCCDIPMELDKLKEIPREEIKKRLECMKDVYRQVEEIHQEMECGE